MDKTKILAIVALVVFGGIMYLSKRPPAPETTHTETAAPTEPADATTPALEEEKPEEEKTENETADKSTSDSDIPETVDHLIKKDIKVGTGAEAKSGDVVTVHYRGTLTNGKQFDASYDRGEPFTFHLGAGSVIQGWDEGVQGMKVGGKRQLIIPSEMGYGAQGAGADIPPNATLVFEVELLKVGN